MIDIKRLLGCALCALCVVTGAFAAELSGVATVNVTRDTAVDAKNVALAQARRQVINQVLGRYANAGLVQAAVKNAQNTDLMNLISSTSIDGERQSDTTYAANITMVLDADASRRWLNANNIQNWLPDASGATIGAGTQIQITMSDRISNWMDLRRIARETGVNINTKHIMGNQAVIEVPSGKLSAFTGALRGHGWGYTNQNGIIKVWR